jgi:hypothetical protein
MKGGVVHSGWRDRRGRMKRIRSPLWVALQSPRGGPSGGGSPLWVALPSSTRCMKRWAGVGRKWIARSTLGGRPHQGSVHHDVSLRGRSRLPPHKDRTGLDRTKRQALTTQPLQRQWLQPTWTQFRPIPNPMRASALTINPWHRPGPFGEP